jgi:uncharacterized protein YdhG (YjbR/CyaY superfamily)
VAGPGNVEEYLAALPHDARAALQRLRGLIRRAAPDATETISYQIPTFEHDGRGLVAYAAFKDHCSLFPMSKKVIEDHREELGRRATGKGTIRFTTDDPLPPALVGKIVKARLRELAGPHP